MPPDLRVAVVGAGQIAQQHLACLAALPGVELAGVCDLSPALAESAAERYGVRGWYTSHLRMLDMTGAQAVHITTPPATHFELARDCLEAGAHVFLEKPAATSLDDLVSLMSMAEGRGRVLVEDYNYLWNESVLALREGAGRVALGAVQHVEVSMSLNILDPAGAFMDPNLRHPALDLSGGPIEDFLPHLASLAHAFCGPHLEVHTVWEKRDRESPLRYDEFRALLRCERATAALSFSSHAQPDAFRLTVHGDRSRATADIFEHRLTRASLWPGPKPLVPFFNALDVAGRTGFSAFRLIWRKLSGGPGAYEGLWRLIERFYAALGAGAPPPLSPQDVLAVNRMLDALLAGGRRA
jgi:predicted dehydrogenase